LTKKLFEIAEQIPDDMESLTLSDFIEIQNGVTSYRLEDGISASKSLFNHRYVSIALTHLPDGKKFPEHKHKHPIQEILIVLSGKIFMTINGHVSEYNEGEVAVVNSNNKHDATAVGDATFVVLTIPRDEGFPE
jgi:quercetin dioxygenase-like cupin family protein